MNKASSLLLIVLLLPDLAGCGRDPAADGGSSSPVAPVASDTKTQTPDSWQAGTHYDVLEPVTSVAGNKVEVVEFFWYGCPHCFALEPYVEAWHRSQQEHVRFVRVPIIGTPDSTAHARLYYSLQALGRPDLHAEAFAAIQRDRIKLSARSDAETLRLQTEFVSKHGIAADDYARAYHSVGVSAALERADQLAREYKIMAVPSLVVNRKYVTSPARVQSQVRLMVLVDDLAARERVQ